MALTEGQLQELKEQAKSRLGRMSSMPMLNHPYEQDRLIASISVIKEVLISNNQLREDLLTLSRKHDETI